MTTRSLVIAAIAAFGIVAHADDASAPVALQKLAGCYHVTYHYVEAGRPDYNEAGDEYIALKKDGEAFVLQHYGIHGEHTMVHWGQRWEAARAGWKLSVTSPSGAPRYECVAPFLSTADGVTQVYRCEAARAPKPRRDRNRTDYNVLDRVHYWHIDGNTWLDEQHNIKRTTAGALVAVESGRNVYTKLTGDAAKVCDEARKLAGE